jgi:RNA polymerase sigma factor (sigma-70 family)
MNEASQVRLVHFVARKLSRTTIVRTSGLSYDELVSAGSLGLVSAAARFDSDRGYKFSTMAIPRIRGAILDAVRQATGARRRHPLTMVSIDDVGFDGEGIGRHEELAAPSRDPDLAIALEDLIRRLSAREREVIYRYYWLGENQEVIATQRYCSEARISQIRTRAIDQLRRWWHDDVGKIPHPLVALRQAGAEPSLVATPLCPRCHGAMRKHNGQGRTPKSCDACRTPAERRHIEYMRRWNEARRQERRSAAA